MLRSPQEPYLVRRYLQYSWDEWRALPSKLAEYYWQMLIEELTPDPDSEDGWDDWSNDPNVVQG